MRQPLLGWCELVDCGVSPGDGVYPRDAAIHIRAVLLFAAFLVFGQFIPLSWANYPIFPQMTSFFNDLENWHPPDT